MESYELKDTDKNIKDTLLHDSISRNLYLYRFIDMLDTIDGSVSIAINGRWGTGKTFFAKQAKLLLEAENPFFENNQYYNEVKNNASWKKHKEERGQEYNHVLPVYYDAWLNDNAIDPILSIVNEIIKQLNLNEKIASAPELKEVVKAVALPFVEKYTGLDIDRFMDTIEGKDILKDISSQQVIHERVNDFFENVIKERGNRLVVFIDELDRCRPDYAVNLLERIKHYFSNENVTYVFSVNIDELQHTIKRFYGEGFSSTEYLDRFFDLTIDIPQIDVDKYFNAICFNSDGLVANVCKAVVSKLDFSMRQAERFSKMIKIGIYNNKYYKQNPTWEEDKARFVMMVNFAPLIIGLRMADVDKYRAFIDGRDSSFLHEIYAGDNNSMIDRFMLDRQERFTSGDESDLVEQYQQGLNSQVGGIEDINTSNLVGFDERLTEIYNAVFNYENNNGYEKKVGQMTFSKDSKGWLMNVVNLFSLQIEYN